MEKSKIFSHNLRLFVFRAFMFPFSKYCRKKRSQEFTRVVRPTPGMKVLDVGGQPGIWDHIETPLKITFLNLSEELSGPYESHHDMEFIVGDGCDMSQYQEGDFDLVFSNSVIEHVGGYEKREMFASEIRRISKHYWIQTPSKFFPVEAHCGMPFWWYYPDWLRKFLIKRWDKNVPAWSAMVKSTTLVEEREIRSLFPEGRIFREWFFFPKSTIAVSLVEEVKTRENKDGTPFALSSETE